MMTPEQMEAARELMRIALRSGMPTADLAAFLDHAAKLLPENEAVVAEHIAWLVRKADEGQQTFLSVLNGESLPQRENRCPELAALTQTKDT